MNATMDVSPWTVRNVMDTLRDSTPSSQLGYLYVPQGKAANTEMKRFLWDAEISHGYAQPVPSNYFDVHNNGWRKSTRADVSPWDNYKATETLRLVDDFQKKFTFTIVRNPYTKLLSGYLDKIVKMQREPDPVERENNMRRHSLPVVPNSFAEFVEIVCDQSDNDTDIHWTSQYFRSHFDFVKYKYIGNFEDLNGAFSRISDFLGLKGTGRENAATHSTAAEKSISDYYTDKLIGRVYDRYVKDFECFGYAGDVVNFGVSPVSEVAPSGVFADCARDLGSMVSFVHRKEIESASRMFQAVSHYAEERRISVQWDQNLLALLSAAGSA